ncbi:unnamed protein product [Hyaloperonospora brassicae]|uniref:Uncharacterized protein n=1 Tax=Hyaloperonospora brassicae TaxID=162125 RepID=A0AAV0UDX4_HYABA|nr:unnamed protein product [Hyaloperonospora brassicae]
MHDAPDQTATTAASAPDICADRIETSVALPLVPVASTADVAQGQSKTTPSAYERLQNGVVYYSRREDKMRVLQEHPVVASVTSDGRTVSCKCGRNVRLNPPWYILKFEQHVASRNCTFLRQQQQKSGEAVKTGRGTDSCRSRRTVDERDGTGHAPMEIVARDGSKEDVDFVDGRRGSGDYSLQSVDAILEREFGVETGGQRTIVPPSDTASHKRLRMYKGATVLRGIDQFNRITPDGRFAECKCSRIVLLSAPWQPGQFLVHVADKQKPRKRMKAASAAAASAAWKKQRVAVPGASISATGLRNTSPSGVLTRPPTTASALLRAHQARTSFPREIRWDVARSRGLLPCPGLRDERMSTFVTSAIQLTGGARHRQLIARELFPHLFSDSLENDGLSPDYDAELDHASSQSSCTNRRPKLQQQLLEAEKLLLHDVIEGEALWFVDKDGNSVRSLDCLGIIDSSKGAVRCIYCTSLVGNAALRATAATQYKIAMRSGLPRNPINRKFCSGRVCSLLEAEFDMQEPFARALRDLALADIPGALNTWMEMAVMGLSGDFDTHPALLGLTDAMVRLKDKERRCVGLQNMTYSSPLDTFMRSLADVSPEACELFQKHLGGRKQRQSLALTPGLLLSSGPNMQHPISSDDSKPGQVDRHASDPFYDGIGHLSSASCVANDESFVHLMDPSVVDLGVPHLSIGDIADVDLSTLPTSSAMQAYGNDSRHPGHGVEAIATVPSAATESMVSPASYQLPAKEHAFKEPTSQGSICMNAATESTDLEVPTSADRQSHEDAALGCKDSDEEGQSEGDSSAATYLSELATRSEDTCTVGGVVMPGDHVPCTGLRDENVQSYVASAVQIIGGSRPRYVIARELFPRVFVNDKKVRIVEKLNEEQRLLLQDAVFSECLWRVDKEGRCVRSLRCKRFVPVSESSNRTSSRHQKGACRACRDLRTVPNFRSVLSRSKVPKKLENIKYVPSVYTESDPFLRKLSKNSAFRGLYQCVKRMTTREPGDNNEVGAEQLKRVHFWLRFARMGVFGRFKSHPVFEGLMKSMVEVKDKERRGVGKQNMQYSQALDEFMQSMVQISTEAFELFTAEFCGRTLRSQKVKRRSTTVTPLMFAIPAKTTETVPLDGHGGALVVSSARQPLAAFQPSQHQHYLMPPDDLLGGRSLSSEESQRFMDCMLDEVRLSVNREMQLVDDDERCRSVGEDDNIATGAVEHEQQTDRDNEDSRCSGPETFLSEEGVLTTKI